MTRRLTQQEFINRAKEVHGDKYDYTKSLYIGADNKLTITCIFHGDFSQTAQSHLQGIGCRQCAIVMKGKARTENAKQVFVEKAKQVHNNIYSYEKFTYKTSRTKGIITCDIHGDYLQSVNAHLFGSGCRKCGTVNRLEPVKELARQTFEEKAREIHGSKYDYSKTIYETAKIAVEIVCRKHGSYLQSPAGHLTGHGCYKCGYETNLKYHAENPTGWGLSNWVKSAEISKYFDSFKVYILFLSNDKEHFYKVGRTYLKTSHRASHIPYNTTVIYEIIDTNPKIIFDLEIELKRKYKFYKYLPEIKFNGMQECFSDLPLQQIIEQYPTQTESENNVSNLELSTKIG